MPSSELFPNLQLVPTAQIRFHEHAERRRTLRLVERLQQDALLRNPPIVADIGNGSYLLLDGANRVSAFRELGFSHIPVQVVDYGAGEIELKGWHHLLVDPASLDLHAAFSALPGVRLVPVPRGELQRKLEFRQVFVVWVKEDAQCWGLYPTEGKAPIEIHQRIAALNLVIACYEGKSPLERIKLADYDNLPEVVRHRAHQLVLYPLLTKEEMLLCVRDEVMLPTGITRHLIPGRALGINVDLAPLRDLKSDEEKLAWFQAHLERMEVEGRYRYYEEAVFIMNE